MKNHWLQSRTTRLAKNARFSRLLQEATEFEKRMKDHPLLKGWNEKFSRAQSAVLLQSHRLCNEGGCWCGETHCGKFTKTMIVNAFGGRQAITVVDDKQEA